MPDRSLADWLELLESRHSSEIELGLTRVAAVWSQLCLDQCSSADPKKPFTQSKVITVAGTNGKGSCIASLEAIILQHGYTVGTFSSPHFIHYNERITLQRKPVSDQKITHAFEAIEKARGEISLTYFEFGTLAALSIFQQESPDFILLEVGLGGRLDAVNIIDADIAVITSIALDHQDWLGNTRTEIAHEKLGIARAMQPLVIGEQDYPEGFLSQIEQTAANTYFLGRDFIIEEETEGFSVTLDPGANREVVHGLQDTAILRENKALAIQALAVAGVKLDPLLICKALNRVKLTGRRQEAHFQGISVILDVAHNPAAAGNLATYLDSIKGKKMAVASVLQDKDWKGIVQELKHQMDQWFVAEISDTERATKGQSLLEVLYNATQPSQLYNSVEQAFYAAVKEAEQGDLVIVFGSFYTVATVLGILKAEESGE